MLSEKGASDPGRLRLRLTLETASATPDGAGGSIPEWIEIATVSAEVAPLGAGEQVRGEGLADLTQQRIVVRKRSGVVAGNRFRLGERIFRIAGVTDPAEDGRYLVCLCEEETP